MLTCQVCGTEYPRRPGRGRQSPFCSDDCRHAKERDTRRRRFLQRFHIIDTHLELCVTCGRRHHIPGSPPPSPFEAAE